MNELFSIFREYDAWIIGTYLGTVLFCSWIGCWLMVRRKARFLIKFWEKMVLGVLGGAAGSFMHPVHAMVLVGVFSESGANEALLTVLLWLSLGALLALPLAIYLAFR